MNKLLTKAAKLLLGLSLAAGVGVAIGSKAAERADAATISSGTTTYTFSSKSWEASGGSGNWTSGKDGGGFSNNGIQVTTTATGANGTSPDTFENVSKVVLTYNTNKSAGVGTAVVKIGSNAETSKSWAYSSGDGRSANYTLSFDYVTKQNGSVKVTINTTTNSMYLVSCAVTCTAGASQLPAPELTKTNNVISWGSVTGAVKYMVTVDSGSPVDNGTSTSFTLTGAALDTGAHTVSVIAKGDGTNNLDSDAGTTTYVVFEHAGTQVDPYTVSDAKLAVDNNVSKTGVYATGIVSRIYTAYNSSYHNISFYFSADGSTSSQEVEAYRCKDDENDDLVSDVAVGDTVIVSGDLTLYGSTYEFIEGCKLVSLSHPVITTTFDVTFDSNGGSENPSALEVGDGLRFEFPSPGTKTNYLFSGWSSDSGTTFYQAGETSPIVDNDIEYVAYWQTEGTPETPYNITQALSAIAAHKGIKSACVSGRISQVSELNNGALTYYISADGTTTNQFEVYKGKGLEGASFSSTNDLTVGWAVTVQGNLINYQGTNEFESNSRILSLVATYSVTYDANGSTGGTIPTDSNSPYANGTTVTVLGNTGSLVKTGYTWNGWNTQSNGEGTHYATDATFEIIANTTLYAEWIVTLDAISSISGTLSATINEAGTTNWNFSNITVTGTISGVTNQDVTSYVDLSSSTNIPSTTGSTTASVTASKKSSVAGSATSITNNNISATVSDAPSEVIITMEEASGLSSSYAEGSWTSGTITGKVYAIKSTTQFQFSKSSGVSYFYNIDAIPGPITNITLNKSSGSYRSIEMFFGTSSITSKPASGGITNNSDWSWDVDSNDELTYFYFWNSDSSAAYFDTITISYERVSTVDPTGITLDNASAISMDTYGYGGRKLTATVEPYNANNKTVTWGTNNSSVVTISDGVLTPVGPGSTTVYACTSNYDSQNPNANLIASVNVTVTQAQYKKARFVATTVSSATQADDYLAGGSVSVSSSANTEFSNTHEGIQLSNGKSTTFTISGYAGMKITGVDLVMSSNGNAGSGSLTITAGSTDIYEIETAPFSDESWNGAYSANPVGLYFDTTDHVVAENETIVFSFSCSVNSIFVSSVAIRYLDYSLEQWCQNFLNNYTCDASGTNAPDADDWLSFGLSFLELDSDLRLIAKNTSANESGTIIEQAMAKYDYIVAKYADVLDSNDNPVYEDFIERNPAPLGGSRALLGSTFGDNTNTIAAIVIISLVSVTAIGGYFFIKRREEN